MRAVACAVLVTLAAAPASAQELELDDPTAAYPDHVRVRVLGRPAPPMSYGEALGWASLGSLGGALIGGALGVLGGVVAMTADPNEMNLAYGAMAGGLLGFAVGPPLELMVIDHERRGTAESGYAWLGSLLPILLGTAAGLLMGGITSRNDHGLGPGALAGAAIGTSLSPLFSALGFWASQG